ncbi:hypothetical protein RJ640_029032 [Escallonia rubra]|uniref:DUF4283 domain-containing protein n=1 Tax=Escallonia rubra TaxID=112253 RepID=A0AA88URE2_9ASTE|nr:hypothetical protein RJ640_029032 [Escallonia rubra]
MESDSHEQEEDLLSIDEVVPNTAANPSWTWKEKLMGGAGLNDGGDGSFGDEDFVFGDEHFIVSTEDNWPTLDLSEELKNYLDRPWRNSLILKLLGRNISYRVLHERISKLWMLKGEPDLIDLHGGYYLVRFSNMDDYHFALEEGNFLGLSLDII